MIETRVPLTREQTARVSALQEHHAQATQALRAALELLTAGHVLRDFSTFRIESHALVVVHEGDEETPLTVDDVYGSGESSDDYPQAMNEGTDDGA
jgi:hypothetical protein